MPEPLASRPRAKEAPGAAASPPTRAWSLARPDPLTSLALATPLFVVYHVGILFTRARNGVDLASGLFASLAHHSTPLYLLVVVVLAVGIVLTARTLGRKDHVAPRAFVPLLLESGAWAVVLTLAVGALTQRLLGGQIGPDTAGPIDALVLSFGAGAHEELIFRVALFGGGTFLLRRVPVLPAVLAAPIAAVVTSVLFSLAHYVGGEPFRVVSFVFRFFMGLGLAAIYRFRGYAVAAWSHALYDVFVFLLAAAVD